MRPNVLTFVRFACCHAYRLGYLEAVVYLRLPSPTPARLCS
jgi:hypothetical protein